MAEERVIKILVEDGQVVEATKDIEKLGHSIEGVEKTSKKAGKETASNFDGVSTSANNLQGGVKGVGKELINVGKAAKKGGAAMRAALISTGIGALVVAVGLLVTNWDSIIESLDTQNKKIQKQHKLLEISATLLDASLDKAEKEKKLAELRGESTEAYIKLEKKLLIDKIANRKETLENTKAELLLAQQRYKNITFFEKLGQLFGIDARTQEDLDAIKALETAAETAGAEFAQAQIDLELLLNPKTPKTPKTPKKKIEPAEQSFGFADPKFLEDQLKQVDKIRENFFNRNKQTDAKTTKERLELQKQAAQKELDSLVTFGSEKIQAQEELDRFFLQKEFELLKELKTLKQQSDEDFALSQAQFEASRIQDPLARLDAERVNLENERLLIEEDLQAKIDLYKVGDVERLQAENNLKNTLQEIDNEITLNADEQAIARTEIAQIEADAKRAIQESYIDHALNAIGVLKSAFEGNKGLQKALLIAESLAGIAKIIVSTQAANAAVKLKYALLPQGAALAAAEIVSNKVGAGIGIAANLVATKKALSALGGGNVSASGNTSGGGSAPSAPSFNVVGTSGVNQLAQSIQGQQQPIEAYVVGANVTSQQALDRNITETASIF
jgi:hypothetical protein